LPDNSGRGRRASFSVAVHAIYKWFPDEKRTLPTAILSQGAAFGVIVAVPALNWVIVTYCWHHAFGALGITGLLWAAVWLIVGKEGLFDANTVTPTSAELVRVPYLQLLTSRTFIGCCLSTFGPYWALSLGITWFTPFIVTGLHFSQKDAGWISLFPWVIGAAVVLIAGWLSQFLVAHGISTRGARGVLGAAPLFVSGLILLLIYRVDDPAILIAALALGSGLSGAIYVVCPAMIGEFTPETQRGAVLSIYGAIYPIAGILAPLTMGNVLQQATVPLEGYLTGFAVNGAILIISGALGLILLRPDIERVRLRSAVTLKSSLKPARLWKRL
jgi:sugar phosphate permease